MVTVEIPPFDVEAYVARVKNGPCFVCAHLDGRPDYMHHEFYRDEVCVAFLSRQPTLTGYSLVAPLEHSVDVLGERYDHITAVVRRVALAQRDVVPTERTYLLSLGSMQGNAHVHWHVAPLPPDVPYERQQFHALMAENGVLMPTDQEQAALAARLADAMSRQ